MRCFSSMGLPPCPRGDRLPTVMSQAVLNYELRSPEGWLVRSQVALRGHASPLALGPSVGICTPPRADGSRGPPRAIIGTNMLVGPRFAIRTGEYLMSVRTSNAYELERLPCSS